ncbi:MAG: 4-hydroxythreonine-4-phosphate dehydrogenase PdxA [Bacteroidetes bacterium]|nr:MAG: 4-hydroxythreonine-4-phosphate dehydrogenase PdxA [Bacteroidota bacterium]
MQKPTIGISIGDINGIGPEVIIKTLQHPDITSLLTPIIYGSSKVISYHKNIVAGDFRFTTIREASEAGQHRVNVLNCWTDEVNIELGVATQESGQFAAIALEKAVMDLKHGKLDALVTAPINKHAMQQTGGFPFPGHTEYITQVLEAEESLMLMIQDELRIGLVTNHLPLEDVSANITRKQVSRKLQILHDTLRMDFGINRPTLAVLGLNPHAGDNGLLGDTEDKIIRPVVVEAKKKGMIVTGPFPADGFFGSGQFRKYDAILAMYHDQGLIPFKLLSFGKGVNYTAGLPAIRTSPDHGTAYDLAGKNQADPSSFRQALFSAIDIVRNRADYLEMNENPLRFSQKAAASDEQEEIIPE